MRESRNIFPQPAVIPPIFHWDKQTETKKLKKSRSAQQDFNGSLRLLKSARYFIQHDFQHTTINVPAVLNVSFSSMEDGADMNLRDNILNRFNLRREYEGHVPVNLAGVNYPLERTQLGQNWIQMSVPHN